MCIQQTFGGHAVNINLPTCLWTSPCFLRAARASPCRRGLASSDLVDLGAKALNEVANHDD